MNEQRISSFALSTLLCKSLSIVLLGLLALSLASSQVLAEESAGKQSFWQQLSQRNRLLGDFNGERTKLEDAGIKFSLYNNYILGVNAKGGRDTSDATRLSNSLDLFGQFDLEKLGLIDDAEILFLAKNHYSRNVNNKVGALSDPFDDADGNEDLYIDILWYQQNFYDKKVQLRLGYIDQQTALDRNAYTASEDKQFMSSLLDNNNAIIPLAVGMGASLFINPNEHIGFVIGAADADFSLHETGFKTTFDSDRDFFGYFQTDLKTRIASANGKLPGTYRFGLIFDPRNRGEFGSTKRDNSDVGFYTSFDQMLNKEKSQGDEGLGWFFRYGYRHSELNRINTFYSTGFQYKGLLPKRDKDLTGIAMYTAQSSSKYERYVDEDFEGETGYELYHSFIITPWLSLAPDIQYKHNPGGLKSARDAVIMGLRMRIIY